MTVTTTVRFRRTSEGHRMTKTMTIRLREPRAGNLELVARLLNVSQAEVVRRALDNYTPTQLADPTLQVRLRALHATELETLQRETSGTVDLPHGGES